MLARSFQIDGGQNGKPLGLRLIAKRCRSELDVRMDRLDAEIGEFRSREGLDSHDPSRFRINPRVS